MAAQLAASQEGLSSVSEIKKNVVDEFKRAFHFGINSLIRFMGLKYIQLQKLRSIN
jgi:hypothetical protein